MKRKILLIFGIFILGILLQANSCADKAMNAATNDGKKALIENTTKMPVVFTHFMNIGDSTTITGIIDLQNAGMGDVIHVDSFTINVPFNIPVKLNIPISAPIHLTINIPTMVILLVVIVILFILFPYIMIVFVWSRKK